MKILFFILASIVLSYAHGAEVIDRIDAIVNDDAVLDSEANEFAEHLKSGAIVDDLLSPDPKKLLADRKALLEHMIDERVIDSEIR